MLMFARGNKLTTNKDNFSLKFYSNVVALFCLVVAGCAPSPSPETSELITVSPPTFSGLTNATYTSATASYTVVGRCATFGSYGLEYSTDNTNWTDYPGGCPSNKQFSVTVSVTPAVTLYARTKTKFSYTSTSTARVTLQVPPNAPTFSVVNSSISQLEVADSIQGGSDINFTAGPSGFLSNALNFLDTQTVGIVYGN